MSDSVWFFTLIQKPHLYHIQLWCERSMCNSTGCWLVFFFRLCMVREGVCISSANPSVFVMKNKQVLHRVEHHCAVSYTEFSFKWMYLRDRSTPLRVPVQLCAAVPTVTSWQRIMLSLIFKIWHRPLDECINAWLMHGGLWPEPYHTVQIGAPRCSDWLGWLMIPVSVLLNSHMTSNSGFRSNFSLFYLVTIVIALMYVLICLILNYDVKMYHTVKELRIWNHLAI